LLSKLVSAARPTLRNVCLSFAGLSKLMKKRDLVCEHESSLSRAWGSNSLCEGVGRSTSQLSPALSFSFFLSFPH